MAFLEPSERSLAEAVRGLGFGNPFLPTRIEFERQALGDAFVPSAAVWSMDSVRLGDNPNIAAIQQRCEVLATRVVERLNAGLRGSPEERGLAEDVLLYVLYYRFEDLFFQEIMADSPGRGEQRRLPWFRSFADDVSALLGAIAGGQPDETEVAHLFAVLFQIRRAFHFTFRHIFGASMAAARLRAAVWQSVFTHDPRRYRRALYPRMHELSTLITGPSGSGKDLVASAIGMSAYIPFDPGSCRFAEDFRSIHLALNLSALSPTLIESELFGHAKGSFTGAVHDRVGFLESRGPSHSVFLDEIGDLDPGIQVKLLRVLQTREFQRIGETTSRHFGGKIIAATNRDLATQLSSGQLREDFYYRLCSDLIETPSLAAQLEDDPGELHNLVLLLAQKLVGEEDATSLAGEVVRWIESSLGTSYSWPGNVRELEQCVRNILVRGQYLPLVRRADRDPRRRLATEYLEGRVDAEELLSRYCTLIYHRTGSYQEAARRLQLDRRTVKRRVDRQLLEDLRSVPAR